MFNGESNIVLGGSAVPEAEADAATAGAIVNFFALVLSGVSCSFIYTFCL